MRILIPVLLAIPLLIWMAWRTVFPAYEWQQTLTFYIDTPHGQVVASNTGHAHWRSGPKILPDAGSGAWFYDGEALVADLGDGKYLFNLLNGRISLPRRVGEHYGYLQRQMNHDAMARTILGTRGEVRDVPFDLLPKLITFGDVNDMETLSFVDPNNLSATLGPGYALERVALAITDEPTTVGQIAPLLSNWIQNYAPPQTYITESEHGFTDIYARHFWRGNNSPTLGK